ncbi:hypothetical protein M434DRAFT_377374 [Hypoxylon sp. CO27-5]|nr:hypothetical protein M434DRAFT_377374 [Hypoxylon sp. CO27-5]
MGAEDNVGVEEELEPLATSRPKNEGHNFLAQSGLLNSKDNPERNQGEVWIVRGGSFFFVVECKMPVNAFKNDPDQDPIMTYGDIYGKPMKLNSPLESTVTVVIEQVEENGAIVTDVGWQYDKYLKSLPHALWAPYSESTDPCKKGNNISNLLKSDEGSITLMAGILITAPKPVMSPDPFPPYQVADANLQRLFSEKPFPAITTADPAWEPDQPHMGNDPKEQYDAVYNAWTKASTSPDDEMQKGFVEILAESLKWKKSDEMKGIAGIPARLKEGFMNLYVAAPLLTK